MARLSLFVSVFAYVLITTTHARPNKNIFEDEEYVSDIVKKGDITKETGKTEKADTKKGNKKQFVIDAVHHGPYHGGHSWGTTSLWPGRTIFPGHGFAAAPGGGWAGYPSFGHYKSKIPRGKKSEVKSSSSPHKRWWPGYSGGWGGWGYGNVGYPGWGPGFGFGSLWPAYGGLGGFGYGGFGHGFIRSGIPAPRVDTEANKRWWPGYSGGWGGWGVGNLGYPGWGSGWAHGWANPGPIGWGAGNGFVGHGYYRSDIPKGPGSKSPVTRNLVGGYHPGVYGWGGMAYGGYGPGFYTGPYGGPGPFAGPYEYGPFGPWGPGGFYPTSFPNTFMGAAEFGPFGNPSGFSSFRRTYVSPKKQRERDENAQTRQVIGYHPGCYGWGGVVYPGCGCGFDCGCGGGYGGGYGGCGGCGGCGYGGCGGCGCGGCGCGGCGCGGCGCGGCGGGCGGCGGGCGGCDCRSKTAKKKTDKDVPAQVRQQIESPFSELGGQSSLFGNTFDSAGAASLGGNVATSAIPGIQADLTQQIENSKSQFPEYSAQYSAADTTNPGELIQNFNLNPSGTGENIGETGNPSEDEGNGFTTMGEMPSRRANIPKQKGTRKAKKQSVAYPLPYGQNVVPFYNALARPVVPIQHLAAVPHYPLGYTAALIPQYHPAHNIHVGSPSVNVDVQTTREHVAKNPEKEEKSKGNLRRLVRDLTEVLEERRQPKRTEKNKRQIPPNQYRGQAQRYVVPSTRLYAPNQGVKPFTARPRYYIPSAANNIIGQPRRSYLMPNQALWHGMVSQPYQSRAPYAMQQQSAMQAMQRSVMNQFQDPPPLTTRQITRMAGISVPFAIQPGAGLLGTSGINKRGKRTAKKKSKSPNSRKRFFLASPVGPYLSGAQLAPAIPMAGFVSQPIAHAPLLVPSGAVPLAPSHMGSYPGAVGPVMHQPLAAYPASALPESHGPVGVPYFSGAAMPTQQNPVRFGGSGILAQSAPIARQGVPNQNPADIMRNWFGSPMQESQTFTNQEPMEPNNFPTADNGLSSIMGGGQMSPEAQLQPQPQQNFMMQPEQPMQVEPQMRSNLMQPSQQMQTSPQAPMQQGIASFLQRGFGRKKSAVPSKKTKAKQ